MKKIYLTFIGLMLIITSCNDVLDESPDNRTEIDTPEKIGELITAAYPEAGYAMFLEPRTDNARDKGKDASEAEINTGGFYWRDISDDNQDSPANYWSACYEAISQANAALEAIKELGGGEKLNKYKGEALLCRAYAHFMLVNIWSKTYDPSTASTDLGIPYVTEPETTLIKTYDRGTVQDVYDHLKADIEEGLPLIEDDYAAEAFHFTKSAAYGFASKFYLYTADWEKAEQYATLSLGGEGIKGKIRDWNYYRELSYSQTVSEYIDSGSKVNKLMVSAPSWYARYYYPLRYQLDPTLSSELFSSGNPTGKPWAYTVYGSSGYFNLPMYDEYFKYTNISAGTGYGFVTYVLLSGDEILLNRAEARVMQGNLQGATDDINAYLEYKTRSYTDTDILTTDDISSYYAASLDYAPFYEISTTQMPFIHGIQELKRREFYSHGLRWFDIRRFNLPIVHTDVEGNSYTLSATDLRKQIQIPPSAVAYGIEENPQ